MGNISTKHTEDDNKMGNISTEHTEDDNKIKFENKLETKEEIKEYMVTELKKCIKSEREKSDNKNNFNVFVTFEGHNSVWSPVIQEYNNLTNEEITTIVKEVTNKSIAFAIKDLDIDHGLHSSRIQCILFPFF